MIDLVTVTEIAVVIAIVVAVIMEVGGDLVEIAIIVVSQDTLPENALVKEVEVVGMAVVVVEVDLTGTEIDMVAAAAETAVVVMEVIVITVIALGHMIVAVLEAIEADALNCAEELRVLQAGCK